MTFKTQATQEAKEVFLNSDEFAEEITYTLAAGGTKVIKAVVVRRGLEPGSENVSRSLRKQAEVYIADDAVSGVTAIDKTDDRIRLKDMEGIDREARINEVLERDGGMWHLLAGW